MPNSQYSVIRLNDLQSVLMFSCTSSTQFNIGMEASREGKLTANVISKGLQAFYALIRAT